MRKFLASLVLSLLPWIGWAQALADWYYWFDLDKAPRESGAMTGTQSQLQVDVSHLGMGAHTLFVQVVDTAGVYSPPVGTLFFHVPDASRVDKLFYSFGGDPKTYSMNYGDGQFMIDVTDCENGFNSVNLQVMDREGAVSAVMPYLFYKAMPVTENLRFRYWFDNAPMVFEHAYGNGTFLIDVAQLNAGFHFVNYYVTDARGAMTDIKTAGFYRYPVLSNQKLYYWFAGDSTSTLVTDFHDGFVIDLTNQREGFNTLFIQMDDNGPAQVEAYHFIKTPQLEGAGDMTVVCIIDGKVVAEETRPNVGGSIKWDMDVSNIDIGLHKAMFQVITPSGAGSSIAESYFIRTLSTADVESMQCSYTIDGGHHRVEKGSCVNGAFHFDLPVDDVEDGLHRLDYRMVAENGASTSQGWAWFYKTPVGGNGIVQYDYWLNDKSDKVTSVTLSTPQDPFQLIKLLPVTTEPIRSSCFHFENKDGQPKIYAKNDIHFRFHEKSGRWVDADRQYVDYAKGEAVKVEKLLTEVFGKETFSTPAANAIRWYSLACGHGDSLAVQSSQATTIQIFAPSGEEVYNVSGDKSVKLGGLHTREDGTYYVAIHDVTGSKSEMTLNYQHIDRYAILDYDVHTVGNGGISSINFEGNGFDALYSMDFVQKGDTIHSLFVNHTADNNVTVAFDFYEKPVGEYELVSHFYDETLHLKNAMKVVGAKDIDLDIKVSYPSTFLRSSASTYTITVTNNGNATAYNVPIEVEIIANNLQNITSIKTKSDALISDPIRESLEYESLCDETLQVLRDFLTEYNKTGSFFVVKDEEQKDFYWNLFSVTIPPLSSVSIQMDVSSTETVKCEAMISEEWQTYFLDESPNLVRGLLRVKSNNNWICCYKERIKCVLDGLDFVFSTFSAYGCVSNFTNLVLQYGIELGCDEGTSLAEKMNNVAKKNGENLKMKVISTLISCVTKYIDDLIKPLKNKKLGYQKTIDELTDEIDRINDRINTDKVDLQKLKDEMRKQRLLGNDDEVEGLKYQIEIHKKGIDNNESKLVDLNGQLMKNKMELIECTDKISELMKTMRDIFGKLLTVSGAGEIYGNCVQAWTTTPDCPPNPKKGGGSSTPVTSYDPNDIYGFVAESGSRFVNDTIVTVPYRIEFENDTTFATASAHTVVVCDTLDGTKFDLTSFRPTSVMIGEQEVRLDGKPAFVSTFDMRPDVNVIAQVQGTYNQKKGIATWTFTSLDPMTMEPTDDVMQGFLPVNYDGSGIGEVAYTIDLKPGMADGTEIPNRAGIVFDNNDVILTPTWTNVVDTIAPTSTIARMEQLGESTFNLTFSGKDNRSGIWKYTLYVQHGLGSVWREEATDIAPDSIYTFKGFDVLSYGFCVLATDSAGNIERKELVAEAKKLVKQRGDVNYDGEINIQDLVGVVNYILDCPISGNIRECADLNEDGLINAVDYVEEVNLILNATPGAFFATDMTRGSSNPHSGQLGILPFTVQTGQPEKVAVSLQKTEGFYTCAQFDMALPQGIHIVEAESNLDSHSVTFRTLENGVTRVLFSCDVNRLMDDTDHLLHLTFEADEDVRGGTYSLTMEQSLLVTPDGAYFEPASQTVEFLVSDATDITNREADEETVRHNTAGQRVDALHKGVTIVKDKKRLTK